jgi:hypothetical protein
MIRPQNPSLHSLASRADVVLLSLPNSDIVEEVVSGEGGLADGFSGAHSTMMEGIGHFPMTENYPLFRRYLLPILRDILSEEVT